MDEPTEKVNNEAEQHIKELNELGANIQPGGIVETEIKEFGGRVRTIEGNNILIEKTPEGYKATDSQGNSLDKNEDVTSKNPEEEIKE